MKTNRWQKVSPLLQLGLALILALAVLGIPGQWLPIARAGDADSNLQLRELGACTDTAGLGVLTFGLGLDGTQFGDSDPNDSTEPTNGVFAVSGLPAGATIVEAWLYWNGSDLGNTTEDDPLLFDPNNHDGDPTVRLNNVQVASPTRAGGPGFWETLNFAYAYRANVLPIVTGNGNYTLTGLDNLNNYLNGAELVVVYRSTTRDPYYLGIAEGMDMAEGNNGPTAGPGTKAVVYQFEPAAIARTANLTVWVGGAGATVGANALWYQTGVDATKPVSPTDTSIIDVVGATKVVNPFTGLVNQNTSGYWDNYQLAVTIPAGNSWLAVQVESEDAATPQRLEWVGATANLPLACPEYTVTKTRTSPDYIQAGQAVVYNVVVTNTGNTAIASAQLQDDYDQVYLSYNAAGTTPAPNTANTTTGLLTWNNIGPIAYAGAKSFTVAFTALTSTEPIAGPPADRTINYANVANVVDENGLTTPNQSANANVEITNPQVGILKERLTASPVLVGQQVTFRLTVSNTGDTALTTVPVTDTYSTTYLTYGFGGSFSTPATVNNTNDGTLNWANVGPLAVGASRVITVNFTAAASTQALGGAVTTNQAIVSGTDENGDAPPPANSSATVGIYTPASIGDRVWVDTNGNGLQDTGEPNLNNVTVRLYDATNLVTPLRTTTTNVTGNYLFADLFPGNYVVEFVAPSGYSFTALDQGANNAIDSDANRTTGRTATIALAEGQNDTSQDAGLYQPASLGNYVWVDTNGNGLQNESGTGLNGVNVALAGAGPDGIFGNGDDTSASTSTAGGGLYSFTNLAPGSYRVTFTAPSGYVLTAQNQGADDTIDSDASPSTGQTAVITLVSGQNDPNWDAGLYQPASLGNFVWVDTNGNGLQTSETGLNGVSVALAGAGPDGVFGNGDDTSASTSTAGGGLYSFTNLAPGSYRVTFTAPSGYVFTAQDQGADNTIDSDANPGTGQTAVITLVSGQSDQTWDAGLYQPASLGNFVWVDTNGNGLQTGETGLNSVSVALAGAGPDGVFGNGDDTSASTSTAGGGLYSFTNLAPGSYRVTFTAPSGYLFTAQDRGADNTIDSDASPSTGQTAVITLVSGQSDQTWDAGLYQPASLGDFVWVDTNGNGIQNESGTGLNGISVALAGAGPDGTFGTGDDTSATTTTVNGGPMTVVSAMMAQVAPSAANGFYSFTNLAPGTYRLTFTAPAGYVLTLQDQGTDNTIDSDASPSTGQTAVITLVSGQSDPTWDAGLYVLSTISGQVRLDVDGDGDLTDPDSGIPSVTVQLWADTDGNGTPDTLLTTTTTNGSGNYSFPNQPPANYVVIETDLPGYGSTGDKVAPNDNRIPLTLLSGAGSTGNDFLDSQLVDLGNFVWEDVNGDGIQNDGAPSGLNSVTVRLYRSTNLTTPISTTTTASGGQYLFANLFPGSYVVEFVKPVGYSFTLPDSTLPGATNLNDSDANATTGRTTTIVLTSGVDDLTWDAGLYRPVTIGDLIFRDANGNKVQDLAETQGVPNVPITVTNITLLTNNVFTTLSDGNGGYLFTNLPPGVYTVVVPPNQDLLVRTTDLPAPFLMVSGASDLTRDFGYINPTFVEMANIVAVEVANGIAIEWSTLREDPEDAFLIYRSLSENGARKLITPESIPAMGSPTGWTYSFVDTGVGAGGVYYYWLEITPQGALHGPLVVPFRLPDPEPSHNKLFIPFVVHTS